MREIVYTSQFKRDYKKIHLSKTDEARFLEIIDMLLSEDNIPARYKDHALIGRWVGCRECHIKPDLLLIYKPEATIVKLMRIGSHSQLFK